MARREEGAYSREICNRRATKSAAPPRRKTDRDIFKKRFTSKLFRGFPVPLLAAVKRTLRTDGAELSTPPASGLCHPTTDLRPQTSGLWPPVSVHRPPPSALRPPTSGLSPPPSDLWPQTSGLRPPTKHPLMTAHSHENAYTAARRDWLIRYSAERVLSILFEFCSPGSVVDIGCGVGTWLSVCRSKGVSDVLGVDGSHVDTGLLQIRRHCFNVADLAKPISIGPPAENLWI